MKKLNLLILFLFSIIVYSGDVYSLENTELDLKTGKNPNFWLPQESIELSFPSNQLKHLNHTIVVELDSIDITAMLQTEANQVSYQPLQPLSPGQHELRVVEYSEEGDIEELGFWSMEVRHSKLIEQYQVVAKNQASANFRVADYHLGSPSVEKFHGQAISQVAFTTNSGRWKSSGQFDLYYDSLTTNRIDNRPINNNEFLFSVGNDIVGAKLGHQKMAVTSLVMDNFQRRGVSLESRVASINSRISGFSLSSSHVIGFGQGLGINHSDQRVEGVTFDSSPFADDPRSLYLTGTWLKGRSFRPDQFISNSNPTPAAGIDSEAWSFTSESLLLQNKLRIRAEYAATDYDPDVSDNLSSDEDDAYSLLVTYRDLLGSTLAWNVGVSTQKIGTFFRSIANQALPSDKQINQFFAGSQWASFGIQANIERQQDNVEKIDFLPRVDTDLNNISLNWTPQTKDMEAWYGMPSFALATNHQSQLQSFTPNNYLFPETNNDIRNWQLSSQFAYQVNSWGMGLSTTDFVDQSLIQSNSETMSFDLYASFVFGEDSNLSVSPAISWNDTKDTTNQIETRSTSYALQSTMMILPKALFASLNINWNTNEVGNNLLDGENLAATLAINWSIRQPQVNQFGVSLNLSSSYNDFNDNLITLNSLETHQTYLSVSVTFPYQAGQANE